MALTKKKVLVTGASGFIGKYFLEYTREHYLITGLARRSGHEAHIPYHPNIQWIQWDISNPIFIDEIADYIKKQGGIDYVIHLAGYYDYDYADKPSYRKTNIDGTKNVLELARKLNVKRFIFASSVAACSFPGPGNCLNERSPADAKYAYAVSKKIGEELVASHTDHFACSIVRFAAIFSDWCEFAPLYKFLSTWLSKKWNNRILGGKGKSAITYLHIYDLTKLLVTIIEKSDALPRIDTYIASPDEPVTHKDLYYFAKREYYGQTHKPFFVPPFLAYPGILFRNYLWKLSLINKPFEQLWMLKYIDQQLHVDASYTRNQLKWKPTPRYSILRRMLFLIVNSKNYPNEWQNKNEATLKIASFRPNLIIYEHLRTKTEQMLLRIINSIKDAESKKVLSKYKSLSDSDLQMFVSSLYHLLLATIRSGDRSLMIKYIDNVALDMYSKGFEPGDLSTALQSIQNTAMNELTQGKTFTKFRQELHDYINISTQLAIDETENIYENLENRIALEPRASRISLPYYKQQRKVIYELSRPMQLHGPEAEKKQQEKKEFTLYDIR